MNTTLTADTAVLTRPAAAVAPVRKSLLWADACRVGRRLARHWDLAGVLALMGASLAYGVYALMALGQ